MTQHRSLTEAHLHENKGVSTAAEDTVATSDGSGNTVWQKVALDNINTTSIIGLNEFSLAVFFPAGTGVKFIYVPIAEDCTLKKVRTTLGNVASSGDHSFNIYATNGSTIMSTISIDSSDPLGTDYTDSTITSPACSSGDHIKIKQSTSGVTFDNFTFILSFERT